MGEKVLDDFEDLSNWAAITSGQAQLRISHDQGVRGRAMRLDYDFKGAGGFVVARREMPLVVPESYSFGFDLRGSAPANSFEFKLIDASDRNVWRYRVEAFEVPKQWHPLRIRSSQIDFAWGPLGGGPPSNVAAIELVFAAGPGGAGTVWVDNLWFHDDTYRLTPTVSASSRLPGCAPQNVLAATGQASWRSAAADEPQWLLIDFQQQREYGGLVVEWAAGLVARHFDVQISNDADRWRLVHTTRQGDGARSYVYLPQTRSRFLRLDFYPGGDRRGVAIRRITVKPFEFSRTINHFFEGIAREEAIGHYPKYLIGRQTYWTVVGTGTTDTQALMNEEGMVEVDKGSFSIEPFIYANGRLVTWADVDLDQKLAQRYLPLPFVRWRGNHFALEVTAFATDGRGGPVLFLRYRVTNTAGGRRSLHLFTVLRPFQVTPTWQSWHSFGGVSTIDALSYSGGTVWVNGDKPVVALTPPAGFGAAAFAAGTITEYLAKGRVPPATDTRDEFGRASGALRFDLDLGVGAADEVCLAIPLGGVGDGAGRPATPLLHAVSTTEQFEQALGDWKVRLGAIDLQLPPRQQPVANTFKTAAAHILINRAGPALHPGPRRYSRSWIRDGVVMGAALLRAGHADAIRDFVRWYAGFQADDGRLPDCADPQGAEWLPEYDAYGEFIFAVVDYYRFTGDKDFLVEMRPAVAKALAYMEGLRGTRLTDDYRSPEKRGCYGLLPESMSHEGYMAHPVHAYWDDFWALRGIEDAAFMAQALGDGAESARLSRLAGKFAKDVRASLGVTMARHEIGFVPGSVEFGDFDPTATAVAVSLLDVGHLLPHDATQRTFDKYLTGFRERAAADAAWNNYSAYEIRIIGALVRLGRRRDAAELLAFMLADRRIPPWNQWPEISWRDPAGPSFIGDLPHTWIGAEYILSIRSMFVYESKADAALVIAAGLIADWLSDGHTVKVGNLPTYYGSVSYGLRMSGSRTLRLNIAGDFCMPPGGIVVKPPLPGPIQKVEINGRVIDTVKPDGFTSRDCPAQIVIHC